MILPLKIDHVQERIVVIHRDELIGLRVRKWSEKHTVDHGENGGIGADAQGEGEHRDGDEAWGFPQHAEAEAYILGERLKESHTARFAAFFFRSLDSAELHPRAAHRFCAGQSAAN